MADDKEKLLKRMNKEFRRNNYQKVIKITNRLLKIDPNEEKAYIFKINSLLSLDEYDKSLKIFKQLLEKDSNMNLIYGIYTLLNDKNKGEEALKILEEAFNKNPENENIIKNLIAVLIDLKGFKTGLKFIDNFPKENPLWLTVMMIKAELFSNAQRFKDSLDVCNEILSNDPKHLDALSKKVFVLNCLGRSDETLEIIDYRIKNNLRPKWVMVDKAVWLMGKNMEVEANEILDEVLDMDPNFGYALSNKAIIASGNELNDLALRYINKALKNSSNKTHDTFLINKAQILFHNGDIVKSLDILDNIDENSPQWNIAQSLLKEYLGEDEGFFQKLKDII
jgi:tetratricopeptide (TPR) repeat protein